MHHVVPRSKGGTKTIPLCESCHGIVHNKRFLSISHLTSKAMQKMKSEGLYTGGSAPYGFLNGGGGQLIEHQSEQAVLSTIKDYRNKGLSLRQIANVLAEQGIRSRKGKPFPFQAVARMVAPC
jgi:hypothetical protein